MCYTYSGKETYRRTSLLYLHDSYPLSHEGIVVYSYEGIITPDLTILMLYLVRTDVVATVGTHRVLHLGSIERERVTREWASDVPCGYYGMIY